MQGQKPTDLPSSSSTTAAPATLFISPARWRFYSIVIVAYCVPPLLIVFRVIAFKYRFLLLIAIALLLSAYSFFSQIPVRSLGIRLDNLRESMKWNLGLSCVFVGLLLAMRSASLIRAPTIPQWNLFFLFYVLIASPAQEFLFRGFLFAEMERVGIKSERWMVVISAVTYCFLHVIYRDLITLGVTLFMGVVWGLIYYKYRNLWAVTCSHAVLGVVSILVGLI